MKKTTLSLSILVLVPFILSSCGGGFFGGGRSIRCQSLQIDLFRSHASAVVDQLLNPSRGDMRRSFGGIRNIWGGRVNRHVRGMGSMRGRGMGNMRGMGGISGLIPGMGASNFVARNVISVIDQALLEFEAAVVQARCALNDLRNQIRNERVTLNENDPQHRRLLEHLVNMEVRVNSTEENLRKEVHNMGDEVLRWQNSINDLKDNRLSYDKWYHYPVLMELYEVNRFLSQVERRVRRSF